MKVWRVMSMAEFIAYKRGKRIRPLRDITACANSWEANGVSFFGTANNAAHWANPLLGIDLIVCLEIPDGFVKKGIGRYPDFNKEVWSFADILEQPTVLVHEYQVPFYDKTFAKLVCHGRPLWQKNGERFVKLSNGEILPVLRGYNDIFEIM